MFYESGVRRLRMELEADETGDWESASRCPEFIADRVLQAGDA